MLTRTLVGRRSAGVDGGSAPYRAAIAVSFPSCCAMNR